MGITHRLAVTVIVVVIFALSIIPAHAQQPFAPGKVDKPTDNAMTVMYYSVPWSAADPDFGTQCCIYGFQTDLVEVATGPNGLPAVNPASTDGFTINDVNPAGEITWWSPLFNKNVAFTGSGAVSLPLYFENFFAPNGLGDSDWPAFLTAEFHGIMVLPRSQRLAFSLYSDDDAFLYVDDKLIASIGGVHSLGGGTFRTEAFSAGEHSLTLFYADRYPVRARLWFAVDTPGVDVTPSDSHVQCDGATANPSVIWPPNHSMIPVNIAGISDAAGNAMAITPTGVFQDEPILQNGSGSANTEPDASLAPLQVRAERDGTGIGRLYGIAFKASDGHGGLCTGVVQVCVPHDLGSGIGCVDTGTWSNSLIP